MTSRPTYGLPARAAISALAVAWAAAVTLMAAPPDNNPTPPEAKSATAAPSHPASRGPSIEGLILPGRVQSPPEGAAGAASPESAQADQEAQGQGAQYVGMDTCLICHPDRDLTGTKHSWQFFQRTPTAGEGCEVCHGPGSLHVDGGGDATQIRNPLKLSAAEVSAICTTCHDRSTHALWEGSQHNQRNLTCTTCHSVHNPIGEHQIKAKTQIELCGTCHKRQANKEFRLNHMPVREGKLQCTSCHNPHGSTNVKLLKVGTTVDELCTSCHAEKRGPYLWEHAPVANSCVTCHDPHGTNNERLLVAKLPFLCQRCHVTSYHPPTVYDAYVLNNSQNANKVYGRQCVVCHTQIHGSNSPSGKALLR